MNLPADRGKALRALLLGVILPVLIFTVIEDRFGTLWGLGAGMIFGAGEIFWEWYSQRRVETLTWAANGMILVLGGVSLFTQEGLWFKLQPALIEAVMALVLIGSVLIGRPLMAIFMEKATKQQGLQLDLKNLSPALAGMTVRIGIFFGLHAALATWAALHWSTAAWALLKGVGFTVSAIVYVLIESLVLRRKIRYSFASK
ncbi:MAG: hypothetical protein A2070_06845 [Bdellovibrionales bacterium GWC1_52_8]|nr:MAG: hypothetical protein A2070_06845 [Bdellovibrionales bacterium GWC1_52_8]